MNNLPTRQNIESASNILKQRKIQSMLLPVGDIKQLTLKLDCHLTGGSYKIRGVENFAAQLKDKNSIQVLSAGNLALATALRLKEENVQTEAIVPAGISSIKRQKLLSAGAVLNEKDFSDIWSMVLQDDLRQASPFLHPLNRHLLAGYATIITELRDAGIHTASLVIPYGLGGLAAAIAHAISLFGLNIKLFLCEITGHAPFLRALNKGQPDTGPLLHSFIEAMGAPEVITDVFSFLQHRIAGVLTVTEDEVKAALREAQQTLNLRIEGAAGAAFAAARQLRDHESVIALMTGANVSEDIFNEIVK
jgi:threonine dehydratase